MRTIKVWLAKVRDVIARRDEQELDAEIEEHLDLLTERYAARGMLREDAAREARRQFGNVAVLKERRRAQEAFLSLTDLRRDLRFGLRMLAKKPGSNATVIIALALGIALNTAVFSFVNALLLRPPAGVQAPSRLIEVWLHNRASAGVTSSLPFTYPDYAYYRDHTRSLEGLLAFDGDGQDVIWNRAGMGQVAHGQLVSGNFFSVLGVNASLGRMFASGDDVLGNPRPAVVLSHSYWTRQFAADRAVLGQTMILNGAACTVIGVAPPGFDGILVATQPDFWAPLTMKEQLAHDPGRLANRNGFWLIVAGRLAPGGDQAQAQAEMQVFAHRMESEHPDSNKALDAIVYPATLVPGPYRGYVSAFTGLLMAAFVLVLLIACANAASFLLARATGRAREMAVRAALGARRGRLVRQVLVESLLLSSIAGIAGIALAWQLAELLLRLKPASLPITLEVHLDWRVLLFTVAISMATGVIFGLAPALRSAQVNPAPVLKEEMPAGHLRKSRMRNVLLVAQIATCVVLLAGATLCMRSLLHANSIDPGFDTRHIALATLDPGSLGYGHEKVEAFYSRLADRLRALPAVSSASFADHLPLGTSREATSVAKSLDKDADHTMVDVFRIGPAYFSTMGIPLLRGRDFTQKEANDATPRVIIVNDILARMLWSGQEAVGQRMVTGGDKETSEVIGVVKSGKYRTLGEGPTPVIYRSTMAPQRTVVVRTPGDARAVLEQVRREVQAVDPMMAPTQLQTIEQYMALPLFPARATGMLLGASGVLAVALTAIGLFGVIAYVVSQRTHEIGIRMALGARQTDVMRLVMRQGIYVTAIGLVIGLAGALAATRLLAPLLYGIGANDPATLAGVAAALVAIAMLACYLPARRATRVEPAVALRYE